MLITLSKECTDFSTRLEILPQRIMSTFQQPTQAMLVRSNPFQIYALKWFENNRILFVSGIVTKHHFQTTTPDDSPENLKKASLEIQEINATFALEIKERLPAGVINRDMKIEPVLKIVAQSFGTPVTCHPNEQPNYVYNGPWDGETIKFQLNQEDHYQISGAFNAQQKYCQNVWVFSFNAYKSWFSRN
ncbi:MAG: hypothetical protein HQL24_02250 [Candidatus Omnitrophica bacterium]|nr:hypothetical protein [Candidatus Omnitrophota bacterium]